MKGNSKTAHPPVRDGRHGQAERAGPQGPEASGIKAGWPRFGTKRGAQPASPTAARRDAWMIELPPSHLENSAAITLIVQRDDDFACCKNRGIIFCTYRQI